MENYSANNSFYNTNQNYISFNALSYKLEILPISMINKDLRRGIVHPAIVEDFNPKLPLSLIKSAPKLKIQPLLSEVETDPLIDLFPKSEILEDEPIWRTYKDFNNSR